MLETKMNEASARRIEDQAIRGGAKGGRTIGLLCRLAREISTPHHADHEGGTRRALGEILKRAHMRGYGVMRQLV